jgi:hypothetical protein
MVLANFDWIWSTEMVGFVVDFLTKPGRALLASPTKEDEGSA